LREAVRLYFDHAIKVKKALTLRSQVEFRAARVRFCNRQEIPN
jgi:hypothetical protein